MRIIIAGDTHGMLDRMYDDAMALGADAIMQVGDTGIWGCDIMRRTGFEPA